MKFEPRVGFLKAKRDDKKSLDLEILEEIRLVCRQIEAVSSRFEFERDNDLIDCCIYEMEALRARYRYLIRYAKTHRVGLDAAADDIVC